MSRFHLRSLLLWPILILGLWQLSQGAYLHAKALLAQHLIKYAWQETLHSRDPSRPWPWADTWPVGRLQVPSRNIDLYVLAGDSGRTLAFGPGHRFGSAMPGGTGISIISAHRDTHFAFVKKLNLGDEILLQDSDGKWHSYRVRDRLVAHESSALVSGSENTLALLTCYPFDSIIPGGPLRFVVLAEPQQTALESPGAPTRNTARSMNSQPAGIRM